MDTQTITFRINPEIKKQFQRDVFKFKFGKMPDLLRTALQKLLDTGISAANSYKLGASLGRKTTSLEIDDTLNQVTYSFKIPTELKNKLDVELASDDQLSRMIKSISHYCRCVCEDYVFRLYEFSALGSPKLMKNPIVFHNQVDYKILVQYDFDKHIINFDVPGMGLPELVYQNIKMPDNLDQRDQLVERIIKEISTKLLDLLKNLPVGEKPEMNVLSGVSMDDNVKVHSLLFDLNNIDFYKLHLNESQSDISKSVQFSTENYNFLKKTKNADQLLNQLLDKYRDENY